MYRYDLMGSPSQERKRFVGLHPLDSRLDENIQTVLSPPPESIVEILESDKYPLGVQGRDRRFKPNDYVTVSTRLGKFTRYRQRKSMPDSWTDDEVRKFWKAIYATHSEEDDLMEFAKLMRDRRTLGKRKDAIPMTIPLNIDSEGGSSARSSSTGRRSIHFSQTDDIEEVESVTIVDPAEQLKDLRERRRSTKTLKKKVLQTMMLKKKLKEEKGSKPGHKQTESSKKSGKSADTKKQRAFEELTERIMLESQTSETQVVGHKFIATTIRQGEHKLFKFKQNMTIFGHLSDANKQPSTIEILTSASKDLLKGSSTKIRPAEEDAGIRSVEQVSTVSSKTILSEKEITKRGRPKSRKKRKPRTDEDSYELKLEVLEQQQQQQSMSVKSVDRLLKMMEEIKQVPSHYSVMESVKKTTSLTKSKGHIEEESATRRPSRKTIFHSPQEFTAPTSPTCDQEIIITKPSEEILQSMSPKQYGSRTALDAAQKSVSRVAVDTSQSPSAIDESSTRTSLSPELYDVEEKISKVSALSHRKGGGKPKSRRQSRKEHRAAGASSKDHAAGHKTAVKGPKKKGKSSASGSKLGSPDEWQFKTAEESLRADGRFKAGEDRIMRADGQSRDGEDHIMRADGRSKAGDDRITRADGRSKAGEDRISRADGRSKAGEDRISRADGRSKAGEDRISRADGRSKAGEDRISRADGRSKAGEDRISRADGHSKDGEDRISRADRRSKAADDVLRADRRRRDTDNALRAGTSSDMLIYSESFLRLTTRESEPVVSIHSQLRGHRDAFNRALDMRIRAGNEDIDVESREAILGSLYSSYLAATDQMSVREKNSLLRSLEKRIATPTFDLSTLDAEAMFRLTLSPSYQTRLARYEEEDKVMENIVTEDMLRKAMKEGKKFTAVEGQTSIDRARRVTADETLPPIPSRPQGETKEEQLDMALEYMDVTQFDYLARKRASIARKKYLTGLTPELLREKYAGDPRMEYRKTHRPLPVLRQAKKEAAMAKFDGWDWDKPIAVHLRPRLPNEADKAEQLLRLLQRDSEENVYTREMREIKRIPRKARREESPKRVSYEYSIKYGLEEFFEYLMFCLITTKPDKPIDFLIELVKSIDHEQKARAEADAVTQISIHEGSGVTNTALRREESLKKSIASTSSPEESSPTTTPSSESSSSLYASSSSSASQSESAPSLTSLAESGAYTPDVSPSSTIYNNPSREKTFSPSPSQQF